MLIDLLLANREVKKNREMRESLREMRERETSLVGTQKKPRHPAPEIPLLSSEPPRVKQTRRPPADPALAEYLQNLPQAILSIADSRRIAGKLENDPKPGLWQNSVRRVIGMLNPDEFVYTFTWNAHCVTMETRSQVKNYFESHGVAFFSDQRFLFFKDPANYLELPLTDIYSVDAHKGFYFDGVSFRTREREVQLTLAGKIDRKLFRDMVIHIAADAANPYDPTTELGPQVCECPGCGASVIIHAGMDNKCEYCDRAAEKQQKAQPIQPSAPLTIAEEIKKYGDLMNQGVISAEEFEGIKATLLSRV